MANSRKIQAENRDIIRLGNITSAARRFLFAQELNTALSSMNHCTNSEEYDKMIQSMNDTISRNINLFEDMVKNYYAVTRDKLLERIDDPDGLLN